MDIQHIIKHKMLTTQMNILCNILIAIYLQENYRKICVALTLIMTEPTSVTTVITKPNMNSP